MHLRCEQHFQLYFETVSSDRYSFSLKAAEGRLVQSTCCFHWSVSLVRRCEPLLVVFSPTMPPLPFLHRCFFSIINILSLTLLNTGDQSLVAMAMKPPMQVWVYVAAFPFCVEFFFFFNRDCTCFPPVRAARPPVETLLSCTALTFRAALTAV